MNATDDNDDVAVPFIGPLVRFRERWMRGGIVMSVEGHVRQDHDVDMYDARSRDMLAADEIYANDPAVLRHRATGAECAAVVTVARRRRAR